MDKGDWIGNNLVNKKDRVGKDKGVDDEDRAGNNCVWVRTGWARMTGSARTM